MPWRKSTSSSPVHLNPKAPSLAHAKHDAVDRLNGGCIQAPRSVRIEFGTGLHQRSRSIPFFVFESPKHH